MIEASYSQEFYDNYDNYDDGLELVKTNSYIVIKQDQLLEQRNKDVEEAMELIALEKDLATLVLIYYKWSLEEMKDRWFDDIERNIEKCGIELRASTKKNLEDQGIKGNNEDCLVCFSPKDESFSALNCGHYFCGDCWGDYLKVKAEDFLNCLCTKCPQQGCTLVVPEKLFYKYITEKTIKEKFSKALLRNYTANNMDIKVCASPSCNLCIKCEAHISKEITCICGESFCFRCYREAHRPCTCEIFKKWEERDKSDSDTDKWIQANTKTCPHCKQKIEKSQGCNYMLCSKTSGGCGKAFCYVCETDWEKHSQDHFLCNKYTPEVKAKENNASRLKAEIERYNFYYKRYINYLSAVKFAKKYRNQLEALMNSIMNSKNMPLCELSFLKEALETVINSKRILKNTYVFGFYLKDGNKKALFEYSQNFLEKNSDRLHQLLEGDSLEKLNLEISWEKFTKDFLDFKANVTNLSNATEKYQKNLLDEIESTMMDMIDEKILLIN